MRSTRRSLLRAAFATAALFVSPISVVGRPRVLSEPVPQHSDVAGGFLIPADVMDDLLALGAEGKLPPLAIDL